MMVNSGSDRPVYGGSDHASSYLKAGPTLASGRVIGQTDPAVGVTVQPMSVGYNVVTAVGSGAATLAIDRATFAPTATFTVAASGVRNCGTSSRVP